MGVSKLDTTQQQQLKDIGAYLQQVRVEQGKSLDEIATRTFIPMRLIRAIEQGQFALLPEPIFVRGFIRRIADALGLDGTAIALEFPLEAVDEQPPETAQPAAPVVAPEPSVEELALRREERRAQRKGFPLSGAVALGLIALSGVLLAYGLNRRAAQTPELATSPTISPSAVAPSPSAVAVSPSVSVSPSAIATPSASVTPVAPSPSASAIPSASPTSPSSPIVSNSPSGTSPVTVNLSTTDRSWVRVTIDGKVAFEGILNSGAQQRWDGQRAIVVRAGNAGAVMVAPNQGAVQPMGSLGSVATQTFTATGLQSQ